MTASSWLVIGIYIAFGLLELVRSDLFSKQEQCRNDGIVEAVSTVLLLTVTQPLIIVAAGLIGTRYFPQYQGALAQIGILPALMLFLVSGYDAILVAPRLTQFRLALQPAPRTP